MTQVTRMSMIGAALALTMMGCENAAGPGAGEAEVQMVAVGDGEATGSQSASASEGESSSQSGSADGEGSIRFRAHVEARLSTGEWVELTRRGAEEAYVQASGRAQAVVLASARAREGSYDRVRVRFEEVEATGVSVQLGIGTTLSGSMRVQSEGGTAGEVEQPAAWTVRAGGSNRLLIDLNSSAWMNRADAQTRTVARADFENAVRVQAQ